jgi:protein CrcB
MAFLQFKVKPRPATYRATKGMTHIVRRPPTICENIPKIAVSLNKSILSASTRRKKYMLLVTFSQLERWWSIFLAVCDRFLFQLAEEHGVFRVETRALVFVGVLGGFTTFSTFSNETMNLLREGQNSLAFGNIAGHLILGTEAVWLGRTLADLIWR